VPLAWLSESTVKRAKKEILMDSVPDFLAGPYMVMAAWYCNACEVAGRSPADSADVRVACWNCDGPVTVTARPAVPRQRQAVLDDAGNPMPRVAAEPPRFL
jgi:hypothetical protein